MSNMVWLEFMSKHKTPLPEPHVADHLLHELIAEVLVNPKWGLINHIPIRRSRNKAAVQKVADLHRKAAAGEIPWIQECFRGARKATSPEEKRTAERNRDTWLDANKSAERALGMKNSPVMPWGRVAEECASEAICETSVWNCLFAILRRAA